MSPLRRTIPLLAMLGVTSCAASPTDLLWRSDAAALAAGGSFAPPAALEAPRADFPTSLAHAGGGRVSLEIGAHAPLTLRRGRREFGEITVDSRRVRFALPIARRAAGAARGGRWHLGCALTGVTERVSHRFRRDTTAAVTDARDACLGVAWSDGTWTLGLARSELDLSTGFSGSTVADLQGVPLGGEGLALDLGGAADTFGIEYDAGDWLAGLRVAERNGRAELPVAVDRDRYTGVLTGTQRHLDAWLVARRGDDRWFAYASATSVDPGPGALFAGDAVRGRASVGADSTVIGVGRRRVSPGGAGHLELSHHRDSLDLSGYLDRGALGGGLTGQYSVSANARLDTIALRWAEERRCGPWRYRYGLAATHSDIDFHGRYVDVPGIFRVPEVQWEQRLEGGEAWLAAAILGGGRDLGDWRFDATLALLAGTLSAEFEDLARPESPAAAVLGPPAQGSSPEPVPTGPGMRLDPGWLFTVSVSRAL